MSSGNRPCHNAGPVSICRSITFDRYRFLAVPVFRAAIARFYASTVDWVALACRGVSGNRWAAPGQLHRRVDRGNRGSGMVGKSQAASRTLFDIGSWWGASGILELAGCHLSGRCFSKPLGMDLGGPRFGQQPSGLVSTPAQSLRNGFALACLYCTGH
jgi:hypothetical protein